MSVLIDSRVRLARDLRTIGELTIALESQVVHKANDRLMPGGLAMVALGAVANQEAFANKLDTVERIAIATAERYDLDVADLMPEVELDDWEPPLQTLRFWTEGWRIATDMDHVEQPTIGTELSFIRWAMDWIWENEPRWDAFVADVERARRRLEAVLAAGNAPVARGVPCMYDECRGARLIRTNVPTSVNGKKAWRLTDWHCPRCKRSWSESSYAAMIAAAVHAEKTVTIERDAQRDQPGRPETWCTVKQAAKRVGCPEGTLRQWIHRNEIHVASIIAGKRTGFVRLEDVIARDQQRLRRIAKRTTAMLAAIRDRILGVSTDSDPMV